MSVVSVSTSAGGLVGFVGAVAKTNYTVLLIEEASTLIASILNLIQDPVLLESNVAVVVNTCGLVFRVESISVSTLPPLQESVNKFQPINVHPPSEAGGVQLKVIVVNVEPDHIGGAGRDGAEQARTSSWSLNGPSPFMFKLKF